MPRRRRGVLPEGVYHVTSRGNRRERLFYTPEAFEEYLKLLRRVSERYGVDVLAYVLMPNHVHLLLRAPEAVLPAFMRDLHGRFAQWHNRRYHLTGHVFEGRYRCWPCTEDRYLWALVRYLHDNPVRAGLADHAQDYRWSSFRAHAGQPDGVTAVAVLQALLGVRQADDLTWHPWAAATPAPVRTTPPRTPPGSPPQAPT
ncbi:MAG: transposase [Armatimonadota bacterium]|nr:transposase [Armatimonadota bacterium]MDR7568154.1 transposase [Armatimonadota bacterium]